MPPLLCEFTWESGYGRVKCVNKPGHGGWHQTTGNSWVTVGHEDAVDGVWKKRKPKGGTEMAVRPPEDDWFAEAGREVSETATARAIRADAETIARRRQIQADRELLAAAAKEAERIRARPSAAAASSAAASFGVTPPGTPAPLPGRRSSPRPAPEPMVSGSRFPNIAADKGVEAIVEMVRTAARRSPDDPDAVLKAAGEWITKITNAITQVVKDADNERDE